ncbi:MAG: LCP family protein, partial [Spirochaetaceae bacterium]|nr:LCP family protein [Spirochaetaceae bacterium]
MRRISIEKSSIPFLVIVVIFAATVFFLFMSLRYDAVDQAIKADRILNLAVIVEREGKPVSTQLFLFYPANGRGAVLDIPGETGLIIKSLNRVDRIDALYDGRRPNAYVREIASLLSADIPNWIVLDERSLASLVDLLEGLEVFVPSPIDLRGPPRAILPSGALILDGDKTAQFAFYSDPEESEADSAGRRQRLFQSLIRRIGEKAEWISRPEVFPAYKKMLQTNLSSDSLRALVPELARLDADR